MHEKREATVEGIALDCGGPMDGHECSVGACAGAAAPGHGPVRPRRRGSRSVTRARPAASPATGRGCSAHRGEGRENAMGGVAGHLQTADRAV